MKYIVKSFVVTFFLIISTNVLAEQKIVVLDMKYVLNQSKAGKGAQDFLKKSFNSNAKKFTELEKKLKKEEADLIAKRNVLSKEDYKKKSDSLRKNVMEYQTKRREALDKIATQRAESKKILLKSISPLIDTYIKENDIAMVMDKKDFLGGKPEYDITEIIVDELNKTLPSLNLK